MQGLLKPHFDNLHITSHMGHGLSMRPVYTTGQQFSMSDSGMTSPGNVHYTCGWLLFMWTLPVIVTYSVFQWSINFLQSLHCYPQSLYWFIEIKCCTTSSTKPVSDELPTNKEE